MLRSTVSLWAFNSRTGSLTGFDIRKFKDAAAKPSYDPWGRHERWRHMGLFSRWTRFKGAFPGFGIATVAFAAYCGFEYFFLQDNHHGDSHGGKHD